MPIYKVYLERHVRQEAMIEIEAPDRSKAEAMALDEADNGLVDWDDDYSEEPLVDEVEESLSEKGD